MVEQVHNIVRISSHPVVDLVLRYSNPIVVDHFPSLVPFRMSHNLNLFHVRCVVLLAVFDFEYEVSIHYQIFALLSEIAVTAIDYDLCEGDL